MLQALLALSSVRSQHPIVPSLRLTDAAQHPFITWIITSGASYWLVQRRSSNAAFVRLLEELLDDAKKGPEHD